MIFPEGLAALLLAGGASTRMGRAKAHLDIGGRPLWRVQMEKLEALGPAELFLSLPREDEAPVGAWRVVRDKEAGLGPLAGIHASLEAMTASWLVVLAVDLPDMRADFLSGLCDAAVASGCGVVPQVDGFYEGLAAVYPRGIAGLCGEQLSGNDRSLQRFARLGIDAGVLSVYEVKAKERGFFRNVNRPEDV